MEVQRQWTRCDAPVEICRAVQPAGKLDARVVVVFYTMLIVLFPIKISKLLFLFLLSALSSLICYGQHSTFYEIKLQPNPKFFNTKENTIIYPIVKSQYRHADSLINARIISEVLDSDGSLPLQELLRQEVNENGLTDLSYEITYNHGGLLSLNIIKEACVGNCTTGTYYFNFDIRSGKTLTIRDVIKKDILDKFKEAVLADKERALKEYIREETSDYEGHVIDSSTYTWAIQQVNDECLKGVDIERFSLSKNSLQVMDECEFPRIIKSQQPDYNLKYDFARWHSFLTKRMQREFLRLAR